MTSNVIRGHTAEHSPDGWRIVETYTVENLSSEDPAARLISAINSAGIPRVGDEYWAGPVAHCTSVSAVPIGPTQAEVTATFVSTAGPGDRPAVFLPGDRPHHISMQATVSEQQTYKDIFGAKIEVSYGGAANEDGTLQATLTQNVAMSVNRPMLRCSFSVLSKDPPLKIIRLIGGKANSHEFLGKNPLYWLCTGVDAMPVSNDADAGYDLAIEITYNPDGWFGQAIFLRDGYPPSDVTVTNGILDGVVLYPEVDFNEILKPPDIMVAQIF